VSAEPVGARPRQPLKKSPTDDPYGF
jgi:hypothetical protein